jgi:integrase/recombinase XerD
MGLVNVTKRVQIDGKGWRFCKAVKGNNGKLRPNVVLIDGQEKTHPEGRYYIDFIQDGQRKRLAAGASAAEAATAAEQQTRMLTAHKAAAVAGITLPQTKAAPGSRLLRDTVDTYLLEVKAHKKPKTYSAYRTALTYFLESCHKQTVEDITRTDLLAFITFLRKKGQSDRKKGQSDRSVANKFESVMSFLKQQKITGVIGKNDRPTFTEEEVETYTQDELDTFFAACTEQERLWFEFFYRTAMREQEVMHAEWSWIDFERSVVTVRENKKHDWKPKAYKGRHISIPSSLLALLKTWKEKSHTTCGLVFPTSGCKPKQNFLDECKAIAERAELNKADFYLHKFRATRATRLLQGGMDIKSVQQMLGHSDLESTMRYLGAQKTDVLQAQIEQIDAQ